MTIYELINTNADVNTCDTWITVFTSDNDIEVYQGNALEYPYENVNVWDYSMYNLEYMGCKVCIDIWADFPKWRIDEYFEEQEQALYAETETEANLVIHGEEEDFFFYMWEEPELI